MEGRRRLRHGACPLLRLLLISFVVKTALCVREPKEDNGTLAVERLVDEGHKLDGEVPDFISNSSFPEGVGPEELADLPYRRRSELDTAVKGLVGVASNAQELAQATHQKLGQYRDAIRKLHDPLHSLAKEAAELRRSIQSIWKEGEEARLASWRELDNQLNKG
mmetsp:Transcript_5865/g.13884  ORF Transcript_5865/g.13884 Transcript_5865/m.13884 type:complete len:164 (-) Transcript_5865:60-551(-)